jgi:hypothetical protein
MHCIAVLSIYLHEVSAELFTKLISLSSRGNFLSSWYLNKIRTVALFLHFSLPFIITVASKPVPIECDSVNHLDELLIGIAIRSYSNLYELLVKPRAEAAFGLQSH